MTRETFDYITTIRLGRNNHHTDSTVKHTKKNLLLRGSV